MDPEWPPHFPADVVREGFGGKLSSYTLALEAWRRGLEVTFLDSELRQYSISGQDGHTIRFIRSRPHMTTRTGVQNANDKHHAVKLLRNADIPAPASTRIDTSTITFDELSKAAEKIGYPVVLKPTDGSMGRGVFAGIQNNDELLQRYQDLMDAVAPTSAVIEKHVAGDDYRVLVYEKTVVAVCRRVPANVVGDGHSTVQALIDRKNDARRKNPFLSKGLIRPDREIDNFLARQGYGYASVPAQGEFLRLRSAANASAGGDVVDVTDEFPLRIKEAAIAAVNAIPGLFAAGVDVLFDSSSGNRRADYSIIELNAHPQIGVNMYPTHGVGQDAPGRIIDICFPEYPRFSNDLNSRISLPRLKELLWPLRTGAAGSVTLKPLPNHRFPIRQLVTFPLHSKLTQRQCNQIFLMSRRHQISGVLDIEGEQASLKVAGSYSAVEHFLESIISILKVNSNAIGSIQEWHGPVSQGFMLP